MSLSGLGHARTADLPDSFSPVHPHPITKETIPITIGHEFSGTIKELGPGLESSHLEVGQKLAIQPTIYCGQCGACKNGAENACSNGGFIGLSGGGGGISEEVVVPAEACCPLPDDVGLDIGALVEPLAVAWHAVDASPIAETTDAKCIVFGGGPIGQRVCRRCRFVVVADSFVLQVSQFFRCFVLAVRSM